MSLTLKRCVLKAARFPCATVTAAAHAHAGDAGPIKTSGDRLSQREHFQVYTTSITVNAPETFQPTPVEHQAAPKPQPPAVPPKPFKDTRIFSAVDTHAVEVRVPNVFLTVKPGRKIEEMGVSYGVVLQVSKEEHKSFKDLVWHLIYARDITNELEKARAIFLWLCSKVKCQVCSRTLCWPVSRVSK